MGGATLTFGNLGHFGLAFLGGVIPSILWLLFWFTEDNDHKEPVGLFVMTFIAGMLAVIIVLPVQRLIAALPIGSVMQTTMWAASEEILKYAAFLVIAAKSSFIDEPVDYAMYMITAALGFAALENTFFLMHPIAINDTTVSFLTGNLRYLGATLLHASSSALIGIGLGLAYFKDRGTKTLYGTCGLFAAIILHSVFNFFIIEKSGENFLQIFGFLWVATIIIMLLFEKLRRMGKYVETTTLQHGQP